MNDFEVTRTLALGMQPMTEESEEAWFESASHGEGQVHFTIYTLPDLDPIGNTGLMEVDHRARTAEFGIAIGDKSRWNQGIGTEVARLMLEYGFLGLGLHNIWLQAYSYNPAGIKAYTRAGFREVGRRREAKRFGGKAYDVVFMDCIATEFEPRVMGYLLPGASEGSGNRDQGPGGASQDAPRESEGPGIRDQGSEGGSRADARGPAQ
jgi:RimJ/RimL family protein N-acetyltransferase